MASRLTDSSQIHHVQSFDKCLPFLRVPIPKRKLFGVLDSQRAAALRLYQTGSQTAHVLKVSPHDCLSLEEREKEEPCGAHNHKSLPLQPWVYSRAFRDVQSKEREKRQDGLKLAYDAVKDREALLTSHLLDLPPFPGQEGGLDPSLSSPSSRFVAMRPQSAPARYVAPRYSYRGRQRPATSHHHPSNNKSHSSAKEGSLRNVLHQEDSTFDLQSDGLESFFADMLERNFAAFDQRKYEAENIPQEKILKLYYSYLGQRRYSQYEFQPFAPRGASNGRAQSALSGAKRPGGRRRSSQRSSQDMDDPTKGLRDILNADKERRLSLPSVTTIIRRLSVGHRGSAPLDRSPGTSAREDRRATDIVIDDPSNPAAAGREGSAASMSSSPPPPSPPEGALSPTQSEVPPHEVPKKREVSFLPEEDSDDDFDQERTELYDQDDFEK